MVRSKFQSQFLSSLSARLFLFTTLFVMASEVLIYFPSAARHYLDLLSNRLATAQVAVLALDEVSDDRLSPMLRQELLANAGVRLVALKRNNTRRLYLGEDLPPRPHVQIDLRSALWPELLWRSVDCLWSGGERVVRVQSVPRLGGGDLIDILIDEAPIRADLMDYTVRIMQVSLMIALVTSALVFGALYWLFVGPMQRLTRSMVRFQDQPEDASRIFVPSGRRDEIGEAESVLSTMQGELLQALQQKAHLAALGTAVAKIQHDLRNILSTAQLASDRLVMSNDPTVKALAPRLMQSIDRAITLATDTLKFGKAEALPSREMQLLQPIAEEAMHASLSAGQGHVEWANAIEDGLLIDADGEQLLRVLVNLGRNGVQALEGVEGAKIRLCAKRTGCEVVIEIADNGPGIPAPAATQLFTPFSRKGRAGGTGLGLSIARELAQAHGGDVVLQKTDENGTSFLVRIPDRATDETLG